MHLTKLSPRCIMLRLMTSASRDILFDNMSHMFIDIQPPKCAMSSNAEFGQNTNDPKHHAPQHFRAGDDWRPEHEYYGRARHPVGTSMAPRLQQTPALV